MNIGEASRRSGLPAKTIRYYEAVGLVGPSGRRMNNYRDYDENDLHRLVFVQRARGLGFTVDGCRELLGLYADQGRTSAQVKALALRRIEEIEGRIRDLEAMRRTLEDLARRCHGDERPACPILEGLAGEEAAGQPSRR